jgi:hypothetical protein
MSAKQFSYTKSLFVYLPLRYEQISDDMRKEARIWVCFLVSVYQSFSESIVTIPPKGFGSRYSFQTGDRLKTDAGWTLRGVFQSFPENFREEGKSVSRCRDGFNVVKKKKAGEGNRTLMTSLEGHSRVRKRFQIAHFEGFCEGVNWNWTGSGHELNTGVSEDRIESDASWTPECRQATCHCYPI